MVGFVVGVGLVVFCRCWKCVVSRLGMLVSRVFLCGFRVCFMIVLIFVSCVSVGDCVVSMLCRWLCSCLVVVIIVCCWVW